MSKCLTCETELTSIEGKREKKFCSSNCRAIFHSKNKNKEKKYVQISTHLKVVEERDMLKEMLLSNTASNKAQKDKTEATPQPVTEKPKIEPENNNKEGIYEQAANQADEERLAKIEEMLSISKFLSHSKKTELQKEKSDLLLNLKK